MKIETLNYIGNAMKEMGINYRFKRWKGKPVYPYFTGSYVEKAPLNEDGLQESTFILEGHSRGSAIALEEVKEKIKEYFGTTGETTKTEDGTVVVVSYSDSAPVNTVDAELEKIQINLDVKEWSVKA